MRLNLLLKLPVFRLLKKQHAVIIFLAELPVFKGHVVKMPVQPADFIMPILIGEAFRRGGGRADESIGPYRTPV